MFSVSAQPFEGREPEFKAVVLALPEPGMDQLTERENTSHALLPIANRPMLWYALQWLEQGGILEIDIVTSRESETDIASYIEVYKGISNISVVGLDDARGTADALRQLPGPARSNVVVVPCDVIVDVPAAHFLDLIRVRQPAAAALFCETMKSEGGGGSTKAKHQSRCVGIDQPSSRLVLLQELEKKSEDIALPMALVRRFPSMALSEKMQDTHVYVLQKWVVDYLAAHPEISSLQDDLLPLLVRAQTQPSLLAKRGLAKFMAPPGAQRTAEYYAENRFGVAAAEGRGAADETDPLQVFAYVRRGGIAGRASQIPVYCDLNSVVTRISTGARTDSSAVLAQQTQVGADSMVGASSRLGERCSVKRSVVGAHCNIGRDVKVVNSVIMDHVTIGDGVKLESCVVCKLATIGGGAQLKACEVGPSVFVPDGSSFKTAAITGDSDLLAGDDGVQTEFV
ncbi:Translation initiation factor eIF-2B subunit gamma [Coemansia sp. RSA 552]|nr:Translation initiation factor eIF-2B subunit gamma [Coemansia sp. RSA 552]